MSVNDPCVSISTGTLGPDLRVKYAQGMILGLGEFLQEQQYFLERDHLHERALHGFGTLYGLQVTIAPAIGADYTVTVSPGGGTDQWGRKFVVRSAQCARLGAWLGAQEQTNPGTIAANLGVSGELTVYVVASYDECPDELVPVPGQPCSTATQTKVASRLRDSWKIELRWSPPPMPAWDTDRRLARLLSMVQIVAGLDPSLSNEDEIIDAVLALPAEISAGPDDLWPLVDWPPSSSPSSPPSSPSGPVVYQLPAETAADALDRIFTVWVTQVRPQLSPGLTEPSDSSDPAILLASITFTLGPVTSPGAEPAIASCDDPDDHGRPYLLHTRLIQELRILGQAGGGSVVTKGQELATLTSAVDGSGRVILTAWFHLDQPVALTGPIQVVSRSGTVGSFDPSAPPGPGGAVPKFSNVWVLTPKGGFPAVDHDQVAVTFVPASVLVGDVATSLAARVAQGLDLIDTMPDGNVVVYGTVQLPPQVVVRRSPPPMEFVTITPLAVTGEEVRLLLWFHPQPKWPAPAAVIGNLETQLVEVVEEWTKQKVPIISTQQLAENVWQLTVGPVKISGTAFLRLVFSAPKILVVVDGRLQLSLVDWMAEAGFVFLNWDPASETITAYTRLVGEV